MCTSFMIGNDGVFDSKNMILHNLKQNEDVNLSGVKGRCLKCLLLHEPQELTTKKQLFDEVWGQFGLFSSDSALLQTIYALRRDLKNVGMSDLIVTHPRLGYQLNPSYKILPVNEAANIKKDDASSIQSSPHQMHDVLKVDISNTHLITESKLEENSASVSASLTTSSGKILTLSRILKTSIAIFILVMLFAHRYIFSALDNINPSDSIIKQQVKPQAGQILLLCKCEKEDKNHTCIRKRYTCKETL